jgi:hypothetical protein
MRKSRIGVTPTSARRMWSRREVLARGAGAVSVLALPQLWIPEAWGQTATFDYYISTTGSDSNAGTLASPWALTSFIYNSANYNKMAGKRIGLVAGSYQITSAFPESGGASAFSWSRLTIPNGTATSPTYVGSCDTNGNYSARAALITFTDTTYTNQGFPATDNSLIGGNPNDGQKNIVLDGLRVNGNGVAVHTTSGAGRIIQFVGFPSTDTGGSSNSAGYTGIVVQNCEVYNMNPWPTGAGGWPGGNYALISFSSTQNAVLQNCYLHDITLGSTCSAQHVGASYEISCANTLYKYNTIANCPDCSGFWSKFGSTGSIAQNNYFYNVCTSTSGTLSGAGAVGDLCSVLNHWDGTQAQPNTGPSGSNVTQYIHHNIFDGCGRILEGEAGSPFGIAQPTNVYSNTVYDTLSASCEGWMTGSNSGAQVQFYNNIYMTTNGSGGGVQGKIVLTLSLVSNLNNNCYYSVNGSYAGFWDAFPGATYTTFASWKAKANSVVAGSESNSLNVNPQFSLPGGYAAGGGAAQFQLSAGSPCVGTGSGGVNMGAWDGTTTQIGCSFAPGGAAGSGNPVPAAPRLTVS